MRLLLTRGRADSEALAARLEAAGHEVLIQPLLKIRPLPQPPGALARELEGVQALLFTSANGVRVFAEQSDQGRDLPVLAVGDATAAAARAAGFARVESAAGDVETLAALALRRLKPADGPLFQAAASERAGDLKALLEAEGFELRRRVVYEALAAERFSSESARALAEGRLDAVLFFSPRTAKTFVRLAGQATPPPDLTRCRALCLSAAVAEAVRDLAWAGIAVAARPDGDALLALLEEPGEAGAVGTSPQGTPAGAQDGTRTGEEDGETMASSSSDPPRPSTGSPPSGGPSSDRPAGSGTGAGPETPRPETPRPETTAAEATPATASGEAPALQVIHAFGGIRPMASKLGVAVSTVQGWRERAAIPAPRHEEILNAAARAGVSLDKAVLAAAAHAPSRGSESPKPAGAQGGSQGGSQGGPSASIPAAAASAGGASTSTDKEKTSSVTSSASSSSDSKPSGASGAATSASASSAGARSSVPASGSRQPDVKGAGSKSPEGKGPEGKAGESKAGEGKSGESKAAETAAAGSGPGASKPGESGGRSALPASSSTSSSTSGSGGGGAESRSGGGAGAWIGGIVLGALLVAGGFAGAVATRDIWQAYVGGAPAAQGGGEAEALAASVEQLDSQVSDLSQRLESLGQLGGRLDSLEGQVEEVQAAAGSGEAGGASAEEIAALNERIDALARRDEELAGRVESAASGGPDPQIQSAIESIQSSLDDLTQRISALDTRVASQQETDSQLQQEIQTLRETAAGRGEASTDAAFAMALSQLRDALRGSGPYGGELDLVRNLVAGDAPAGSAQEGGQEGGEGSGNGLAATLSDLNAKAESGIPTLARLKERFPGMAREVMAVGYGEEAEGLWQGVVRRISRVVTFRPSGGEVEGDGPGAVLARAEARLEEDDLAGAVEQLRALAGPAAEAAQGWMADAEARLAAERAIASLSNYALARLAGQDG